MNLRSQRSIDNYVGRLAIAVLRPAAMLIGAALRRNHDLTVGNEVVWVKMLGGGSLLLGMPMLLGFRRAHPTTKMILVTTPSVKPFADMIGVFDEYRLIDVSGGGALLASATRALWQSLRADCIIDLEVHSRLTTVFTTLTLARNRVSFWLEDIFWRRGLASHLIFFNRASGSFHFYDRIADLFGFSVVDRRACRATLIDTCGIDLSRPRVDQVCIGFACSDLGRERMLTADQWVRVFRDNLQPSHKTFVFLGGPNDRARADAIIAAVRDAFPKLVLINKCGELTLKQSVAVLFESPEFWGIDSSLLHQARVAGLRCLSFWGPTDPQTRLRDSWQIDEKVVYRKIACSPCVHTSEEPPCRGDNRCIQGLFDPERAPLGWTPIEYPGRGA